MTGRMRNRRRGVSSLAAIMLSAVLLAALPRPAAMAAETVAAPYVARIAARRPPCTPDADLPVVPNDPGALTLPGGERHCYGTRPAELELWLPRGRYVWLQRSTPSPAVWIDLGTVLVDPRQFDPPPLGLRVTGDGDALTLELRDLDRATLTPLRPGHWQEVQPPAGRPFWINVDAAGDQPASRSMGETITPLESPYTN